jgi:hypothetical protein
MTFESYYDEVEKRAEKTVQDYDKYGSPLDVHGRAVPILRTDIPALVARCRALEAALKLSHQCHENLYAAHWGHLGLTAATDDISYREVEAILAASPKGDTAP